MTSEEREAERKRRKEEKELERQKAELEKLDRDTRTVFAYNLSTKADERDIYKFFSKAGTVNDVRIIYDRNTPRSKGMAYIEFADKANITDALALTGQMLRNQVVMVKASEAEKNIAWEAEQAQKKLEMKQANKIIGVPIIEELPDDYEDGDPTRRAGADAGEYKMVLVVREDLPMGAGKVGAQCAHGAVGAVNIASKTSRMELGKWELDGQKKVTLGVRSLARFEDLVREAKAARLPTFVVEDAGRTEVEAGTKTMVAIGPASTEAIDKITGSLRLY